jgi:hypothetical protein
MGRVPVLERIKTAIMDALGASERKPSATQGEAGMADEKQLETLSAKVNAIEESLTKLTADLPGMIANAMKPLTDAQAEIQNAQKAAAEAEKADLVNKVVKANILTEEAAKGLTNAALKELAAKAAPGKAAALNAGGFGGGSGTDEFEGYSLNAAFEEGK